MKKITTLFFKFLPFLILLMTLSSFAQTIVVSGEVYDDTGNLLPGVSVLVEGTTNGVTTDFEGKYAINIKTPNATLVFAYLGFETKKVIVSDQKKINVILKESLDQLDEIQVATVYKKDEVIVEEHLDNSIHICKNTNYGDKYLRFTELPAKPIKEIEIKLPAITRYKSQYVPPANHPWRNFQFGNTQEIKQRIKG
jgi:hypothetical protein